jgi:7-cyano-7-deazaguanine synthase
MLVGGQPVTVGLRGAVPAGESRQQAKTGPLEQPAHLGGSELPMGQPHHALGRARAPPLVDGLVEETHVQHASFLVIRLIGRVNEPLPTGGVTKRRTSPAPGAVSLQPGGIRGQHVEGQPAASGQAGGDRLQEAQQLVGLEQVLKAMESAQGDGEARAQAERAQIAADEQAASAAGGSQAGHASLRARQHRGGAIDAHQGMAVAQQGQEQAARAAGEIQHRPGRPARHPVRDQAAVEGDVGATAPVLVVVERRILERLASTGILVEGGGALDDLGGVADHDGRQRVWNSERAMTTAIVLLSGGLDSATALAMTRAAGKVCHALSFRYGQRHVLELEAAARVARALGAASHRVLALDQGMLSGSALTGGGPISKGRSDAEIATGIPTTYVPARNTLFVAHALAVAETTGADEIVLGINAVDYSGYPDCRPEWLAAMQEVARLGTRAGALGRPVSLVAPLVHMTKADIVREGARLGVDFALTLSCYDPGPDARACGTCDSCILRRRGFEEAGISDPARC